LRKRRLRARAARSQPALPSAGGHKVIRDLTWRPVQVYNYLCAIG
jgi:hypothetical protein